MFLRSLISFVLLLVEIINEVIAIKIRPLNSELNEKPYKIKVNIIWEKT